MIFNGIGLIIGILIFCAAIYYFVKEKEDMESRKIYGIASVVGLLIAVAILVKIFPFQNGLLLSRFCLYPYLKCRYTSLLFPPLSRRDTGESKGDFCVKRGEKSFLKGYVSGNTFI